MIYAKVNDPEGVIIGKVSIISLLLTLITIRKYPTKPYMWRLLKLKPIEDYPFYRDYDYLMCITENVQLSIVPFDKTTFEIPKPDFQFFLKSDWDK